EGAQPSRGLEGLARVGPTTPTRARRPFDASVDPTAASKDVRQALAMGGTELGHRRRRTLIARKCGRRTREHALSPGVVLATQPGSGYTRRVAAVVPVYPPASTATHGRRPIAPDED